MPASDYIERNIIGKRFILAVLIILYFAYSGNGEGLVGSVMGYYFVSHGSKQ